MVKNDDSDLRRLVSRILADRRKKSESDLEEALMALVRRMSVEFVCEKCGRTSEVHIDFMRTEVDCMETGCVCFLVDCKDCDNTQDVTDDLPDELTSLFCLVDGESNAGDEWFCYFCECSYPEEVSVKTENGYDCPEGHEMIHIHLVGLEDDEDFLEV